MEKSPSRARREVDQRVRVNELIKQSINRLERVKSSGVGFSTVVSRFIDAFLSRCNEEREMDREKSRRSLATKRKAVNTKALAAFL